MTTHNKLDVAEKQLKSAIALYVTGRDRVAAITLAGAADGILSQLARYKTGDNFANSYVKKKKKDYENIGKAGKKINTILGINELKHFDKGDKDYFRLDVDTSGVGAILKTIVNYTEVTGRREKYMDGFIYWMLANVNKKHFSFD